MPDCPESTLTVAEAQQRLAAFLEDLRRLDQRLSIDGGLGGFRLKDEPAAVGDPAPCVELMKL